MRHAINSTCLCIRLFVLLLLSLCLAPKAHADDTNVTLYKVSRGNVVYLVARLTHCTEVSITFSATVTNMVSSTALPQTVEVTGPGDVTLAVFTPLDTTAPSSVTGHFNWEYGRRLTTAPRAAVYQFPFHSGPYRVLQAAHGTFSHNVGTPDSEAIDWAMPIGTLLYPARAGTVIGYRADSTAGGLDKRLAEDCNYVIIKHDDGTMAEYLHLQKNGVLVQLGARVTTETPLALSGNTGYTTEPHLHFAVFTLGAGSSSSSLPVTFQLSGGVTYIPHQGDFD